MRGKIVGRRIGHDHLAARPAPAKVVTPTFAPVEAEGAVIDAIREYLENLLARYDAMGGFGIGCLIDAICQARRNESAELGRLSDGEINALARFTIVSVQGLWSLSPESMMRRSRRDRMAVPGSDDWRAGVPMSDP